MMDAPTALRDRRTRVGASLVVAALAIVVTGVGHGLAGGAFPHPVALLLGLIVTTLVGVVVIGPRASIGRLALGVAVDQLLLHALFTVLGTAGALSSSGTGGAHASHLTPWVAPTSGASDATGIPALLDPVMAGHHALAGVVVLALLLRGRASIVSAITALGLRIRRALTPLQALRAPVAPRPSAPPVEPAAPRSALAPRAERRRGPPVFALAA